MAKETMTLADREMIAEAAASLFISDGGQEAAVLLLWNADGHQVGMLLTLAKVVDILCHHLEVK